MKTLEERFWEKVDKSGDCWLWTASLCNGYGELRMRSGRRLYAHRLSWELANGPILSDLEVDHRCHVRRCVRPDHLRLVTHKQNTENRSGAQRNSKSGVRGVSWDSRRSKWRACVTHDGRYIHVGYFDLLEDATAAAVTVRRELFSHSDGVVGVGSQK